MHFKNPDVQNRIDQMPTFVMVSLQDVVGLVGVGALDEGVLLLLLGGLGLVGTEHEGNGVAVDGKVLLDEDLHNAGNVLGVVGVGDDCGLVAPEHAGTDTDGQVGGGHHVFLKRRKKFSV